MNPKVLIEGGDRAVSGQEAELKADGGKRHTMPSPLPSSGLSIVGEPVV